MKTILITIAMVIAGMAAQAQTSELTFYKAEYEVWNENNNDIIKKDVIRDNLRIYFYSNEISLWVGDKRSAFNVLDTEFDRKYNEYTIYCRSESDEYFNISWSPGDTMLFLEQADADNNGWYEVLIMHTRTPMRGAI